MPPVIYFRDSLVEAEEREAAMAHFRVVDRRTLVRPGELVIPRYSALPYNRELCEDLVDLGATPINTFHQHCYVADIRNWYYDLAELTPRTWFALDQIPRDGGPFVLKGATNSRKHLWETHVFAADARAAAEVFVRLGQDSLVGVQPIYIRQYVPLERLGTGLHGLPISTEFRFFVLDGEVIAAGFYWASHTDEVSRLPDPSEVPEAFLNQVIAEVEDHIRFWVVDVAKTADGRWLVVELNDGQQSGLCTISPEGFYCRLKERLNRTAA